ncbi:MAG: endopeptidase La, partial [Deltaproteobacteria bacterium RIFCSPHIGHO2_02_FULL_40_11]
AGMPQDVKKEALKQADRLERMHPDSSESTVVRNYLEWLCDVPWSKHTEDAIDLKKAKEVLDEDHYGLEKIKERILEFLAVRKIKEHIAGPILCFVGPPGVGKTSLGKSIARAMGRKFHRISLGGVRDEAEIRGHRRTYVGAMPGKIIQGLKQVQTNNPIFMLDEVDKLGADFRGDPSSALLEVLDPEQNNTFTDHYLNVHFNLSKVLFIATANLTDPIPPALKDRMEVIQIPGYTAHEKIKIAQKFLVPKQMEHNGLKPGTVEFADSGIQKIIHNYTQEAGLRNLEREIAGVCRKVARQVSEGYTGTIQITDKNVPNYLGIMKYFRDEEKQEKNEIGIATGLAWTPYGGEVLSVEAREMKAKNRAFTLTGQLGDVMKESAQAALTYLRSKQDEFNIPEDYFETHEIHIHVPQGAIPKDGPSAGVTLATAMLSMITKRPVRKDIAMTGEISLSGKVYAVGGVRDKVLAALRNDIQTVIIPYQNHHMLTEIPKDIRAQIKFIFAKTLDDVFEAALEKEKEGQKPYSIHPVEKAA